MFLRVVFFDGRVSFSKARSKQMVDNASWDKIFPGIVDKALPTLSLKLSCRRYGLHLGHEGTVAESSDSGLCEGIEEVLLACLHCKASPAIFSRICVPGAMRLMSHQRHDVEQPLLSFALIAVVTAAV